MQELLQLDVRTLGFVSSIGGVLLAGAMLGIYLAGMRERCLLDWTASGLATGGGFLIGHLFQTVGIPLPTWIVISVANALIALGHGLLLIGVQRHLGRRCWTGLVIAVTLAMLVSPAVFGELKESLRWRIVFHSGWYAIALSLAAWLLWTARHGGMRSYHRLAASVFGLYAIFLWARWIHALFEPALTTSFVQNLFQGMSFLSAMLFGFFIAVALALMMFRQKELELRERAENDPLTGIKNRLTMDRIVNDEIKRARADDSPLGVLLLDLDDFKQINDSHGHAVGDLALKQAARAIMAELRGDDVAFRFGGEEFLILLPGTAEQDLVCVAERLRHRIEQCRIESEAGARSMTASIGITALRYSEEDWETCLKRVDDSLYKAKGSGKNRIEKV